MTKRLRSSLAIALLWVPHWVSAKAPTVRITVAGGKLARPVEITDIEALRLSNAWGAAFLDGSRPPLKEAPKVRSTYEVTLYSEIANNDIRKTCVFYYAPASSAKQGLIYLPGKGTLWVLNAGTIIRHGRDGEWSYASPAWEALIKSYIADGKSEASLSSASMANNRTREHEIRNSSTPAVEKWVRPRPGWLYVLDSRSGPHSRIWLLDPERSKVMGSVRAGYDPDFCLSPDGTRLYIASGERESGELTVIDTVTGDHRHIPFNDRVLYKPWYEGLPPFSDMAVSSDGLAVLIPRYRVVSPGRIESRLWVFDAQGKSLLSKTIDLGDCSYVQFVRSSTANRYGVFCEALLEGPNRVRFFGLNRECREMSNTARPLPWPKRCAVADVFFLPRRNKMAVIRTDGAIYEADWALQNLSPTSVAGDCAEWRVAPAEWPRSADGSRVYVGYGGISPDGMSAATELRVFDTNTWKQLGRVQTSVPFWSGVASHDGKYVYAIAPAQHKVLVIDAVTLQERRAIDVGSVPSIALVAR